MATLTRSFFEKKSVQLLILFILTISCAAIIFLPSRAPSEIGNIQPTTQIEVSLTDPFQEPNWVPITLPDDWDKTSYRETTRWYRIKFDTLLGSQTMAMYVPMLAHHGTLWLNGVWQGQTGSTKPRIERHHNTPILFEFATDSLNRAKNELILKVSAVTKKQGILSEVYIGNTQPLQKEHGFKTFFRIDWIQWASLTMFLISALLAGFWLNRRQDVVYGIFSVALFSWATHNLNLFVHRIPVPHQYWEALMMITLGWTVVAILFFDFRFLNRPSPRVERFMLIYAVSGLGFFFMPSPELILTFGYTIWDSVLIFLGGYAIYYLIKAYNTDKAFDAWLMMLVGLPILLTGLHDILLVNGLWPKTDGLIIQYSVAPTGLLFGAFLIRRFIHSLNVAEKYAELLEEKVKLKESQLKGQFEQIKNMEIEQMLSSERDRIMRDVHDGIGGQLVALQSKLNEQDAELVKPLQRQLKSTITDFRLVIDSLDPLVNDIPTLLGQMRSRIELLLESKNVELNWDVHEVPDDIALSPEQVLHLMRIIQEAVTNSMKHAQTSEIRIGTISNKGYVSIQIDDKGKGFDPSLTQKDVRGVRNMQYRAQRLGAQLLLKQLDPGMRVEVNLPLDNS